MKKMKKIKNTIKSQEYGKIKGKCDDVYGQSAAKMRKNVAPLCDLHVLLRPGLCAPILGLTIFG